MPFDGEPRFWKLQGNQVSYYPPFAKVTSNELIFPYAVAQHERAVFARRKGEWKPTPA